VSGTSASACWIIGGPEGTGISAAAFSSASGAGAPQAERRRKKAMELRML
jgi:hypothetical protein